jgi:hypothetical protein
VDLYIVKLDAVGDTITKIAGSTEDIVQPGFDQPDLYEDLLQLGFTSSSMTQALFSAKYATLRLEPRS